jgi:hypothetical protein
MRESAFAPGSFTITPGKQIQARNVPMVGKNPVYQKLDYAVHVYTSLENLVTFLEHFYRTNLLHQIKTMTIQRPLTPGPGQQPTDLDVNFTVEALIIDGAEKRDQLLPGASPKRAAQLVALNAAMAVGGGPAGIALLPEAYGPIGNDTLARSRQEYAAMADKNIFLGFTPKPQAAQELTVTRFVRLNNITRNDRRVEAYLWNRYDNKWIRLRTEAGFDYFRILNEKGDNTVVRGKVVRIDNRELIFKVDDKYYSVHLDQTLEEAMKKPLTGDQRKDLGLVSAGERTAAK